MLESLRPYKKPILIGSVVLLAIGIGIAVYFIFFNKGGGGGGDKTNCPTGKRLWKGKCLDNCKNGLLPCGPDCYDPDTSACVFNKVCNQGNLCSDKTSCCTEGEKCNPDTDQCVKSCPLSDPKGCCKSPAGAFTGQICDKNQTCFESTECGYGYRVDGSSGKPVCVVSTDPTPGPGLFSTKTECQ